MSAGVDDFRELAAEEVVVAGRVVLQVRADSIWVGFYRTDKSPHAGGSHLWSRRYARPAGKSEAECVEACLRMAHLAQSNGLIVE